MTITILAALPQEYAHFKRLTGRWRNVQAGPFKMSFILRSGIEIMLIETGMGKGPAMEALSAALGSCTPDLIISAGFAGSLCGAAQVGGVFLADRFELHSYDTEVECAESYLQDIPEKMRGFCARYGVGTIRVVTATRPEPKFAASNRWSDRPSLLDMESFYAARSAYPSKTPLLCFRAVSDGLEHEIDFDLGAITDSRGRVKLAAVAAAVLARPRLIKSFGMAWRRSSRAGRRLGEVLFSLLNLPAADLFELVSGCVVRKEEME